MPVSVLIAGGGIAGPALAFWLHRAGYQCTIVERSPVPRTTGQQIDLRGAALEIVKRMGLESAVRARTVQEQGIAWVDGSGKRWAEFAPRSDGASFSAEIEILRGELAQIFYEATKDQVAYVWGNHITAMWEQEDGVEVEFVKDGPRQKKFDLVVAADGMNSHTRGLAFDDGDALKHLGQYMAYFTVPPAEQDTHWATWYNAPGGRLVMMRPDLEHGRVGAYLAVCGNDTPKDYLSRSVPEQRAMWEDLFKDAGGEASRVIEAMHSADDFYMQQIGQVKMPRWTKDRIVLLGDSAYCPSPISGLGASCAVIGAYILAGELVAHGEDHQAAFASYERIMRPVIDKAQKLIPGAPALANPQTSWGIFIEYSILGLISWSGLANWFQGGVLKELVDLPDYRM